MEIRKPHPPDVNRVSVLILMTVLGLCLPLISSRCALAQNEGENIDTIPQKQLDKGKQRFDEATSLFKQKKFDSALVAYEDAYDVLQGYPNRFVVLFNIGKCHEALKRFDSAIESYQLYLEVAGPQADDRTEVEAALEKLEKQAANINEQFAEGKKHVEMGRQFFEKEDFGAALAEFEKAYEQLEGHPMRAFVYFNVGRCYEKLFQYTQALTYYQRYLDEAGPDAEDRATVEATLHALKGLLGTLVITSNVNAEVWVDNSKMGIAPGKILIPGGRHSIELRADGYESTKSEIQITARETQELTFMLNEIMEYEGLHQGLFWTGAALSVATLGAGIAFGTVAMKKDREGKDAHEDLNQTSLTKKIDRLSLTADILYGTAAVLAISTTVIFFLTDWKNNEESPNKNSRFAPALVPAISQNAAGLVLQGRF